MYEAFEHSSKLYPNNNCLGWREQDKTTGAWSKYKWMDYKTVHQRKTDFGAGLMHLHKQAGVSTEFPHAPYPVSNHCNLGHRREVPRWSLGAQPS